MKFQDASKVLATITATDDAARIRAENRVRVNRLFNGEPLLTSEEAKKLNMRVNVNWGEAPVLGQHGRRQYSNAFLSPGNFFKVTIPDAPPEKASAWSSLITRKINRVLKDSEKYVDIQEQQWASVLIHGIGPKVWEDSESWCPSYIAIEDLRVPTDTRCVLDNLSWFAVRKAYTEGELSKKVFGKNSVPGWNKPLIRNILHKYHDYEGQSTTENWGNEPEKMAELVRQNGGYYSSDAVPTIPLWHFYFEDEGTWKLRVVPDQNTLGAPDGHDFLFDNGDKPTARDRKHLLHVQYGDLNTKTPFLYHSVRSLGFLLMEPCFYTNLTRCRSVQHLHEMMNVWLRSNDPTGKARSQKVELYDRCYIPEGVTIVPQAERHQVDKQLLEWVMDNLKGLQKEASVSYTSDTEGQRVDETATAVMARVSQVNAMMSGLLSKAFRKEKFAYQEICRRFCIRGTNDPDARKFQADCKKEGIPALYLNVEFWDVEPEVPMGSGNPTMEMAKANQLMAWREMYDATAQQEILHQATIAVTENPRMADRLVPLDQNRGVTDAQEHAELAFSTLMFGVPVRPKEGLNPGEQIETLLGLMAGVIARIEKSGNVATAAELAGLTTVQNYIGNLIGVLSQNKAAKSRVKQYSDALGKLGNPLKGFAQRLKAMNGNGEAKVSISTNYKDAPPEIKRQIELKDGFQPATDVESQVDPATAKATHAMAVKDAAHQQKQQHQDEAFKLDQRRKDAAAFSEIERQKLKAESTPPPAGE